MGRPPMLKGFRPQVPGTEDFERIMLHFDEYEALKLCDYEGLNQLEAARQMHVSRPTFTRIYDSALKKIARAFVEYKEIHVGGGNVLFDQKWFFCNDCKISFRRDDSEPLQCPVCHSINFTSYGPGHIGSSTKNQGVRDGFCICPSCGKKQEHLPGVPCRDNTCDVCGVAMIREGSVQHQQLNKIINDKKYQKMKVAIPSKSNDVKAEMDAHFGRCAYFAVFDKASGDIAFYENPAKNAEGGAGPKAVEFIAEKGVERVYSRDFGPKAKSALNALKIEMSEIYEEGISVQQMIDKVK